MQGESGTRPWPAFLLRQNRADAPTHNFAETLPLEMSERILGELDPQSLGRASLTCRRWYDIIQGSEELWRRRCVPLRAVCQREVDGDRRDGLSWKLIVVKNYRRSCVKSDWLSGRYSHVTSAKQLIGRRMVPLDAETWGEILQAELDRGYRTHDTGLMIPGLMDPWYRTHDTGPMILD